MRAASLEDSCRHMKAAPPRGALLDAIHDTGVISGEQAAELREYITGLADNQYLVDETLLLLEAAGHVEAGAPAEATATSTSDQPER